VQPSPESQFHAIHHSAKTPLQAMFFSTGFFFSNELLNNSTQQPRLVSIENFWKLKLSTLHFWEES
jgi:hypothetical protein